MNSINSLQITKTCCFTGHRIIPKNEFIRIREETKSEIERLIKNGITTFVTGGALGYDMLCAQLVLEAKERRPNVQLHLALPCKNQTRNWSSDDILEYDAILHSANTVTYVSESYYKGCMHTRNRYMINNSAYCISYCFKKSGGTFYKINYAKQKDVKLIEIGQQF